MFCWNGNWLYSIVKVLIVFNNLYAYSNNIYLTIHYFIDNLFWVKLLHLKLVYENSKQRFDHCKLYL